jgi:hypothetical protein
MLAAKLSEGAEFTFRNQQQFRRWILKLEGKTS